MEKQQISDDYLREFFGIRGDEEGNAELEEIKSRLVRLQFKHGEDICRIDDEADGMYFLESGTAVVLNREGEQINIMRSGQYFGEYAAVTGQRRLSTVRSVGRTLVYRMENEDVIRVLQRHPDTYGDLMKRVYGQVSGKHSQMLALSRMQRGILQHPSNSVPMTPLHMALQYGALAVVFLLAWLLVPKGSAAPIFILPLFLLTVYVFITHRTVESLAVAGMMAALMLYRNGLSGSYVEALMNAMGSKDNVFTVLVMALMGGVVTLIEASGAVTAFKKLADRKIATGRGVRLAALGIMAVTAIDDGLNMLCAATSLQSVADEQQIPREDSGLLLSFLPTTLSSFLPFSLWGIFVIGTMNAAMDGRTALIFCKSIPFNFFSILAVLAMVAFCFGKLPRTKRLKQAQKRVDAGGELWPEGSEKYLVRDETEVWGKLINLILPVVALAVFSLAVRSIYSGGLILDSAVGLMATLIFMFLLYCAQGLMTPEQFVDHLVNGIQGMVLPIILYLMTMCFSTLLDQQALGEYFNEIVEEFGVVSRLMPAILFLFSTLVTVLLGSSWAMYAIALPAAMHISAAMGLNLPLCVGAVAAAGIAGEKNCVFTSDSMSVGNAIGCDPKAVLGVRLPYSIALTILSLILYVIAGFLF